VSSCMRQQSSGTDCLLLLKLMNCAHSNLPAAQMMTLSYRQQMRMRRRQP
jgi:hypothetical protein